MICDGCKEIVNESCSRYSSEGMKAFDRKGYCPFTDISPNKDMERGTGGVRVGQQKQRKVKHKK
uniref:Uncharacterized protein n=1 Tax=viral metagenome TaxID=1070528 RepID=A0A6M3KZ76_9ZZZZ